MPEFHFDIEQRSPEWDAIRSGKLTASIAWTLITPTGKPSTRYKAEIARIIAEAAGWQEPGTIPTTHWMERGVELEAQARAWFTIQERMKVQECGFVASEDSLFGFSPDGLYLNGVCALEIKVPKPSTHVQWMIDGGCPKEHLAQVHFGMIILEQDEGCFMSYHPEADAIIEYVQRSEYTEVLEEQMTVFTDEFCKSFQKVMGETYIEFTQRRTTL